ncbi:hypothetical protein F511_15422 [Dorcoceras hygrometricum]|uniref:Dystroglycan-like n=1 Tax=Dorcoceras hygrometricum TaxID=472368 RepID=A0A2Z7A5Q1_9LAMI|nr:hypothetical protein F511_15422 [Dorcoceras hygrometricum]
MASSLISSIHHIDFDSVFGIDDTGLVQMFETLITTGLKEFLGCPIVFYEAALTEFFGNSSVRDGVVVSTIRGTEIEISENIFSTTFGPPTEGLTDFSEVPKDLVFDARSLFSVSKEQVSISCLKKEMKIQYRPLSDILAKTLYVKAGSFDAVTRDRFMLMTAITFDVKVNWSSLLFGVLQDMVTTGSRQAKGFAIQICVLLKNVPGLVLGESRAFPASRVLTEKTVHRYVIINEKVVMEETADAPRVKKTPAKKVVSTKRPVGDGEEAPIVKKKRTTKEVDDEIVDSAPKQPAAEATTDDADHIIQQILGQLDSVTKTYSGDQQAGTDAETIPWFDLPFVLATRDSERLFETASDSVDDMDPDVGNQALPEVRETDVILKTDDVSGTTIGSDVWNQQLQIDADDSRADATINSFISDPNEEMEPVVEEQSADEAMSLENILILPQIQVDVKGKELLVEKDPVKGNPVKEQIVLTLADIACLVQLREKISLSARLDESQSEILSKLHTIEKGLRDSLRKQEEAFRTLIQGARQEGRTIDDVQTLRFNEFKKGVLANSASVTADLMDIKKAVRELNAKVDVVSTRLDDVKKYVEATKEAISHKLLDFQAQAQANHNILTGQLSELVNYINRGGNDKKVEGSSRGPQPPPDDQNRYNGNAGGDTAGSIVERLISADRERERSRGNRSGPTKEEDTRIEQLLSPCTNLLYYVSVNEIFDLSSPCAI